MVPAEDPTEHFGTKRRVVVWLYIQNVPISCKVIWEVKTLMLSRCHLKNGRFFFLNLDAKIKMFQICGACMNLIYPVLESNKRLESYEHPKGAIPNLLLLRIIT